MAGIVVKDRSYRHFLSVTLSIGTKKTQARTSFQWLMRVDSTAARGARRCCGKRSLPHELFGAS
eukprot:1053999-Amphidinium_carterae.1